MKSVLLLLSLLLASCGGTSDPGTGPSPMPTPTPTPAPIPAPDPARFDAAFNEQLVHGALDTPGVRQPARLLKSNPSIYLQRDGLSDAAVAAYEASARAVVPLLTGGQLTVASFEVGIGPKPPVAGWIVVDLVNEPEGAACGRSEVGLAAGHIWLNIADRCKFGTGRTDPITLGHEIGHALGFYHVDDSTALMFRQRQFGTNALPTDKERYHAGLAYQSNGAYTADRVLIVD